MWRVAAAFTLFLLVVGVPLGAWETWALRYRPDLTITEFIKRHTHLAIIAAFGLAVVAMLFGYALGLGGA